MYKIVIVMDEAFGSRLLDLAREACVWVIESDKNQPWIDQAWAADVPEEDPNSRGVTSFTRYPNESVESLVIRVVEMVDEHHGEYAHDPPWSGLEIYGTSLTDTIATELRGYGVDRFEVSANGFLAWRTVGCHA